MSLSHVVSSPTASQNTLRLHAGDGETSQGELSESLVSTPIMRPRSHVMDGLPEDIKRYWLYDYVLDWNASDPAKIAKTLHHMATISKEHLQEVIEVVKNEPVVALAYTAHAMRGLAETAITLPPNKKLHMHRYLAHTDQNGSENDIIVNNFGESVKDFAKLYTTSCINLSTDERKEFSYPEWLRAALAELLGAVPSLKRIRLDFSMRRSSLIPQQDPRKIFRKKHLSDFTNISNQIDEVRGSAIRIMARLASKVKKDGKDTGGGPVIELIIKNNLAALHELSELPSELNVELIDASMAQSSAQRVEQTFSHNNSLLLIVGADLAPLSAYIAKKSCQLTTLILHDCTLDSSALVELTAGLEKNSSIKTLDLSKNLLRRPGINGPEVYDGLFIFNAMLATSTSLLHLNFAHCSLHDDGAALFYEALKANPNLLTLNLRDNNISHDHPVWSDTRVIGNSVSQVK